MSGSDGLGRVVIVGGVAGGMSTATRLRRLDAEVEIVVIERSGHVSFANCGLPYFVGGVIEEESDLTLQTPESLFARFELDVRVDTEVVGVHPDRKALTVRSTKTGEEGEVTYDALVLSTGAAPVRPPIPGYERARTLRTVEDASRLASEVGVEAMSLYRYVTGREDILEAVVTRLLGGVTEALDTQLAQTWQGYLQTLAHTVRDLAIFLNDAGKTQWSLVDRGDIEAFLAAVGPGLRPRTLTVLRQFFRWARTSRLVLVDPTTGLRIRQRRGFKKGGSEVSINSTCSCV